MIRNIFIFFIFAGTVLSSCSRNPSSRNLSNNAAFNLDSIRTRGRLIAVTDYNSIDYFIYKGEPMGFNYELLKSFSDYIGIDLEIVPENHPDKAYSMLEKGQADLLALNLIPDSTVSSEVLFTTSIGETRHVLVQRKSRKSSAKAEGKFITDLSQLQGKTIYVQSGSSCAAELISLSRNKLGPVSVIEVPFESEKLIQNVSRGVIDYTVCEENIALVNSMYYQNIDICTALGPYRDMTWGVRKMDTEPLQAELDKWITGYKKTSSYVLLYAKYFRNSGIGSMVRSDLFALKSGKVSEYDNMIRHFSTSINWDWRLLASLICQESHFDPSVESQRGAIGLMQIMPETARNFGIDVSSSAENNIKAGISYINWLHTIFDPKIADERERINFILASYNAGPGHVLDAMKLAAKNGMNPQKWEGNVAVWLLKKSQPEYYNDSVVKNGYFKGVESVNFVSQVLERYEHYKNIIP